MVLETEGGWIEQPENSRHNSETGLNQQAISEPGTFHPARDRA